MPPRDATCAERRRRSGDGRWRAGSLKGGFIRTQAACSGGRPAAAKARAGAATSRTATLTRAPRPLRCTFSLARAASRASISTSVTSTPSTRVASASPAAPTPAPRSIARSPPRAGHAAASRMASWPTRCPRFGCARRSLPPSTASSVTSASARSLLRSLAIGTKLVSKSRILQQGPRLLDAAVLDQDTARQDADRPLEHAHVAVEHHMPNSGAVEQRLDGGDQHGVIGADELAQLPSPSNLPPIPLVAGGALLQIGDQLHLPAAARHGVEHETGNDRKEGQQHQAGREARRRNARNGTLLEIGHENRHGETDGNDGQRDAEAGEEGERPLRAVEVHDGGKDSE